MRTIVILILVLLATSVNAEVYRWEYNGQVTYSDKKPHPNAKRIKVKTTTYKQRRIPNVPALNYNPAQNKRKDPGKTYRVSIVSPENKQAINVASGNISISFEVTPSLVTHAGHQIHYRVGNVSGTTSDLEVMAKNVHRGTHTISVTVKDDQGKALSPTTTSTVTVLRPSLLFKTNAPMAPRAPTAPKAK